MAIVWVYEETRECDWCEMPALLSKPRGDDLSDRDQALRLCTSCQHFFNLGRESNEPEVITRAKAQAKRGR